MRVRGASGGEFDDHKLRHLALFDFGAAVEETETFFGFEAAFFRVVNRPVQFNPDHLAAVHSSQNFARRVGGCQQL